VSGWSADELTELTAQLKEGARIKEDGNGTAKRNKNTLGNIEKVTGIKILKIKTFP
jgi:hypothetical protein